MLSPVKLRLRLEKNYYLVLHLKRVDNKVWKLQEKVYQNMITASTLNSSRKCGRCLSAKILPKKFSFSRFWHFAITKAFHDMNNDLNRHHRVLQVKINCNTKFCIVFVLRTFKVGVLEHKNLNKKTIRSIYAKFATSYT